MKIQVMSWNMGGAKLFGKLDSAPKPVAGSYMNAYRKVFTDGIKSYLTDNGTKEDLPDIILLQECVGFVDHREQASGRWHTGAEILQSVFEGYSCFFFPALSSFKNPHPKRWQRFRQYSEDKNYLPDFIEAEQGYGICVKNRDALRRLWVIKKDPSDIISDEDDLPKNSHHLCFEVINTASGSYLGTRDTEPRLIVMGRMKHDSRYINFINLHLPTLQGERDGNIRINRSASVIRQRQIDLVLDNVISAYQETTEYRVSRSSAKRQEDLWLVGGDFNATPDAEEISLIRRMGFVDGNPDKTLVDPNNIHDKQIGTKWSTTEGTLPPIVLDYIFCGLERTSFFTGKLNTAGSRRPYRPVFEDQKFESDHAVVFASFEL